MKILLDQSDGDGGGSGSAGLNAAATAPPPAWPGFRPLTVTRIQPESRTVFSLHLATMDSYRAPAALPGQFITVKVQPEGDVPPLIRSYSLSGEPGTGRYRISVKVEPHGAAGDELRAHIHVGDHLEAAAPRGTFCLTGGDNPVVLLSAGVGATPCPGHAARPRA